MSSPEDNRNPLTNPALQTLALQNNAQIPNPSAPDVGRTMLSTSAPIPRRTIPRSQNAPAQQSYHQHQQSYQPQQQQSQQHQQQLHRHHHQQQQQHNQQNFQALGSRGTQHTQHTQHPQQQSVTTGQMHSNFPYRNIHNNSFPASVPRPNNTFLPFSGMQMPGWGTQRGPSPMMNRPSLPQHPQHPVQHSAILAPASQPRFHPTPPPIAGAPGAQHPSMFDTPAPSPLPPQPSQVGRPVALTTKYLHEDRTGSTKNMQNNALPVPQPMVNTKSATGGQGQGQGRSKPGKSPNVFDPSNIAISFPPTVAPAGPSDTAMRDTTEKTPESTEKNKTGTSTKKRKIKRKNSTGSNASSVANSTAVSVVSAASGTGASTASSDKKRFRSLRSQVKIYSDGQENRLTQPLLQVPKYPPTEPAHAAEMWGLINSVYRCLPDTYTIAYQARILGFDVPAVPDQSDKFPITIDCDTIPRALSREDDPSLAIPDVSGELCATFATEVWGNDGDSLLDYVDPVWKRLTTEEWQINEWKQEPARMPHRIHHRSLLLARELNLFEGVLAMESNNTSMDACSGDDFKYRFATEGDVADLEKMWSRSSKSSVAETIRSPVDRIIVAERRLRRPHRRTPSKKSTQDLSGVSPTGNALDTSVGESTELAQENPSESYVAPANPNAPEAQSTPAAIQKIPVVDSMPKLTNKTSISEDQTTLPEGGDEAIVQSKTPSAPPSSSTSIPDTVARKTPLLHYVHYRFIRVPTGKEKKGELILYIVFMSKSDNLDRTKDSTSIEIVSLSIALERARELKIWYALLHVPETSVKWYKTYFRMTECESKQRHEVDGVPLVPLVCDLNKLSPRYSFLLRREHVLKGYSAVDSTDLIDCASSTKCKSDRLIVRFQAAPEEGAADSVGTDSAQKRINPKKGLQTVHMSREKLRAVVVGVQAKLDVESDQSRIDVLRNDTEYNQETVKQTTLESSTNPSPPCLSWEVLRMFPADIPAKAEQVRLSEGVSSVHRDEWDLMERLRSQQKKLVQIEDKLEPRLRELLSKASQERLEFERPDAVRMREEERSLVREYKALMARRTEEDRAKAQRREEDLDAVCDICHDGEVTPDNMIIFCECCNVAIHQFCYGVDKIPEGDYFCHACRFTKTQINTKKGAEIQEPNAKQLSPLTCELCTRRGGAFVRTIKNRPRKGEPASWVHTVCAKWAGIPFVDPTIKDAVEDVTELKEGAFHLKLSCCLCERTRGAYAKCSEPGCKKYLHVTCARATGLCKVIHGETCKGPVDVDPWSVKCPEHSVDLISPPAKGCISLEQLREEALSVPEEEFKPHIRQFPAMSGSERRSYLADDYNEQKLLKILMRRLEGAHCFSCNVKDDGQLLSENGEAIDPYTLSGKKGGNTELKSLLAQCVDCGLVIHPGCYKSEETFFRDNVDRSEPLTASVCDSCRYIRMNKGEADFEIPQCHVCNSKVGLLRHAIATPGNKVKSKDAPGSLFARKLWCHATCGLWDQNLRHVFFEEPIQCSMVVLSSGFGHILPKIACALCCRKDKLKTKCDVKGCRSWGSNDPFRFHITCARQAGLQVSDKDNGEDRLVVKCFRHVECDYVLRAKLEDLIEIERVRSGPRLESIMKPMPMFHAARLFHMSVTVLQCLGWAWRWAEWWVEFGDNWEPLLEPGQIESKMTDEELRKVPSDRTSRCRDARRCRLTAFSAALRTRAYDIEVGDDRVALHRALRAVLHTPSLVGPLEHKEIEFFVEWLGRVYRSNSPLLGFGEHAIPVANEGHTLHLDDHSPKDELGKRPLPGKEELPEGLVFETAVDEVDDFLKPEVDDKGMPFVTKKPFHQSKRHKLPTKNSKKSLASKRKDKMETSESVNSGLPSETTSSLRSGSNEKDIGEMEGPLKERRGPGRPRTRHLNLDERIKKAEQEAEKEQSKGQLNLDAEMVEAQPEKTIRGGVQASSHEQTPRAGTSSEKGKRGRPRKRPFDFDVMAPEDEQTEERGRRGRQRKRPEAPETDQSPVKGRVGRPRKKQHYLDAEAEGVESGSVSGKGKGKRGRPRTKALGLNAGTREAGQEKFITEGAKATKKKRKSVKLDGMATGTVLLEKDDLANDGSSKTFQTEAPSIIGQVSRQDREKGGVAETNLPICIRGRQAADEHSSELLHTDQCIEEATAETSDEDTTNINLKPRSGPQERFQAPLEEEDVATDALRRSQRASKPRITEFPMVEYERRKFSSRASRSQKRTVRNSQQITALIDQPPENELDSGKPEVGREEEVSETQHCAKEVKAKEQTEPQIAPDQGPEEGGRAKPDAGGSIPIILKESDPPSD